MSLRWGAEEAYDTFTHAEEEEGEGGKWEGGGGGGEEHNTHVLQCVGCSTVRLQTSHLRRRGNKTSN